ncbi:predicted protein [Coccidioides posadasii str. Silveira]|uniref:Predicted protein n=1 Tax=Coccidioides posadasii (strain RMSCC 757 / Silveira) TaxID=443226 RepID=E9CX88_COCPS|nr:predicted protein [Coccidioides posadasii str. Silveira]
MEILRTPLASGWVRWSSGEVSFWGKASGLARERRRWTKTALHLRPFPWCVAFRHRSTGFEPAMYGLDSRSGQRDVDDQVATPRAKVMKAIVYFLGKKSLGSFKLRSTRVCIQTTEYGVQGVPCKSSMIVIFTEATAGRVGKEKKEKEGKFDRPQSVQILIHNDGMYELASLASSIRAWTFA